ncbi:membrane protein implicated in regulation of membrane protease activity [Pedobacter sp. CG_S7]|uniref:NfeD family protein n=1 Tax=Pedobacter sp. CG_S7 TaxID=3143930 RepID=UPI0033958900
MEDFSNSAVIWFGLGLAFFLLEFLIPGFILFFFGIGAWIVAILTLFTDLSINVQLLVFLVSSVISVILFRNYVKNKLGSSNKSPQILEEEYIGKIALAETAIEPGLNGKVEFKGASWDAQSDDTIAVGENVMIIETHSILLIVKSTKSI